MMQVEAFKSRAKDIKYKKMNHSNSNACNQLKMKAEIINLPLHQVKKKQNGKNINAFFLITTLLLVTAKEIEAGTYDHCGVNKFACRDGSCIPQEKVCNGRLDCSDNSDEIDCDSKLCLKPDWFQCTKTNGPCLAAQLVCNGIENCPGGEDEYNCAGRTRGGSDRGADSVGISVDFGTGGWHTLQRNCSAFEYTCLSDKSCIPLDFMCDGKNDCHDASDETAGCLKAESSCRGFFCGNKKCLESTSWICDGVDDCGDGSDERNCLLNCTIELGNFRCHNNETCIALDMVCDGKADCKDGSDESTRCTSERINCSTKTCPTASKCQIMPDSGPECICPKGFRHSLLQNACIDINECLEQYALCSQNCDNRPGTYKCSCDEGYQLQSDNKTCKANGEEALLLYTTQITVMGVHLRSHRVFQVAGNLSKVIGVSYDGENIYWTNIQNEAESIVKAKVDGTQQDILLTSGLDAPEDLAVDWLTGNIYFSDNVMRHIAVCSKSGLYCNVLVTIDVHQPRGIALWPQNGQMFWTDWGIKPMIARASMDGRNSLPIVTQNIHWPNGIALDMHNNRIYWVDAKFSSLESVKPDGTDRRIVIEQILKHPYGLAVFEDQLYWSDWATRSVHSCNKFTGKDHKVIVKDRTIYAVHVYHTAKQPKINHACSDTRCSHLCLLAENNSSTCACPDGMQLSTDQQRCIKMQKKQRLFIGVRNLILEMEHTSFGRHVISHSHQLAVFVSEMVYNSINGTIIIADNVQHKILEYDLTSSQLMTLVNGNIGNVTGIAFDHYAYNIYWTDSDRHVVEVFSLITRQRAICTFFKGPEIPIGIAVIPEEAFMFVALRTRQHIHIDQQKLSGQGEYIHVFEDELGYKDINFVTDYESKTLFWCDSDLGRISFTDYHNMHAYTFRGKLRRPFSIAIVEDDIFWSELRSSSIHWTHKSNMGPIKRLEIEVTQESFTHAMTAPQINLLASSSPFKVDHLCQHENGGCSHLCINTGRYSNVCLCPPGLVFKDSYNRTCIEILDCEFRCRSGECLTQSRRCNGRKDCPDGSDEILCDSSKHAKLICSIGEFTCHNAEQCISNMNRCDGTKHCHDGSDELHCEKFDQEKRCHSHQLACDNGHCVDMSVMCDDVDDCGDNTDEKKCKKYDEKLTAERPKCEKDMFQCNVGTCIAKSWECDGKLDCTDGSDEHDKCGSIECPAMMHRCLLGQCIDSRLVCDGHNDCGDHSDELNCDRHTGKKLKMSCGSSEHPMYQCNSDKTICLELNAKCNGTAECPRGEDEADCGGMCSIYEFQCHQNKECIRIEFRCDHEKDCPDGSDELNCNKDHNSTTFITDTHERPCERNMFDCKDGKCVDITRVCDGYADCDTGADEGLKCKLACTSTSGRSVCQHKCRATPTGAICSCFHGYKLDTDYRTCIDINECEESNPCAQQCTNTHGSYKCSCYPEFMLRTDKTTCKSIESNSTIMFSTFNEVRSMSEQPIVLRRVWSANDSKIAGFDINVRQRSAYFTTENENILYAVDMDTGNVKDALFVEMPTKLSVDWITDNVYVISRSKRYGLKVCAFSAKICGNIIEATSSEIIKAITFDAFNRKLFYVIVRTQAFLQPKSQILFTTPDGLKREKLLNRKVGYITAIAADPFKKILYFVDSHSKSLESVSYALGSNRRATIIVQKGNVIMQPSGLSLYEDHAYIVNFGAKEAIRCKLFGTRDCNAFNLNILNAEDVVINGASRQPLAINPCDMAKCSGMCLQAEHGYECMCGDAIVSESVPCPSSVSNAIVSSALLFNSTNDQQSSHATAAILLSLLFVILLVCAVGLLYYRRLKQRHHRDFNINLHFQNPLSSAAGSNGKSSTIESTSTATSYDNEERLQPIRRFLHGTTSITGSEITLEPRAKARQIQTDTRKNFLVEYDSHYYSTPADGNCNSDDDDARARLVS